LKCRPEPSLRGVWRAGLSKIEARLRRVNDAELLVLARVLKCGVADLHELGVIKEWSNQILKNARQRVKDQR
jgi:hypothetical protein